MVVKCNEGIDDNSHDVYTSNLVVVGGLPQPWGTQERLGTGWMMAAIAAFSTPVSPGLSLQCIGVSAAVLSNVSDDRAVNAINIFKSAVLMVKQ